MTKVILVIPAYFIQTIFKRKRLEEFLHDYQKSTTNFGRLVWALVTLELWWQQFFNKPA